MKLPQKLTDEIQDLRLQRPSMPSLFPSRSLGCFLSPRGGSFLNRRGGARLSLRGHFERHGRALFVARAYLRHTERVVVGPFFVSKPQAHSPLVRSSRCPPRASLRRLPSAPLPPPVARVRPCARAPPPSKVRSPPRRRRAAKRATRAKTRAADDARPRAWRRTRRADPRRSRRHPFRDWPAFLVARRRAHLFTANRPLTRRPLVPPSAPPSTQFPAARLRRRAPPPPRPRPPRTSTGTTSGSV